MARWEPDALERLKLAAMELFGEHGYDQVTVAGIAARAGLTKRSFFNHFADKRELLFEGAPAFEAVVLDHLPSPTTGPHRGADPHGPGLLDDAVRALTAGGLSLSAYIGWALARRDLIASSLDLQERNLSKMASLATAIARTLTAAGAEDASAMFAAQAAVIVFAEAYDRWTYEPAADFASLMQRALDDFRLAVAAPSSMDAPPSAAAVPPMSTHHVAAKVHRKHDPRVTDDAGGAST